MHFFILILDLNLFLWYHIDSSERKEVNSVPYLTALGKRIRQLRLQAGLSQDALAKITGYTSRSSINKIELGYTDIPITKAFAIANALNVSPVELFFACNDQAELTEEERLLMEQFVYDVLNYAKSLNLRCIIPTDEESKHYSAAHTRDKRERGIKIISEELSELLSSTPETDDDLL